jgi:hypothetical protein
MTCVKVFCTRLHVVEASGAIALAISLPGPDSVRYMGHCGVVFDTFFRYPTNVVPSTSGTLPSVRLEPPSGISVCRATVCAVFEQMAGVSANVCENGGRLDVASFGYVWARVHPRRASYVVYEKLTCGCVDIVGDNVTPGDNVPRIMGSRSHFVDEVVPRVVGENTTQRGKDQPMSENSTALGVNTGRYAVCTAFDSVWMRASRVCEQ